MQLLDTIMKLKRITELKDEVVTHFRLFGVSAVCLLLVHEVAKYAPEKFPTLWVLLMACMLSGHILRSAFGASRKSRELKEMLK
jgi:hypothetical protein